MVEVPQDRKTMAEALYKQFETGYLRGPQSPYETWPEVADLVLSWLTATAEAARAEATGRRWRHVKRGTEYTEIGRGELQMGSDLVDGSELVFYRGEDGKLWARQVDEFEDGRFVEVAPKLDAERD